MSEKMREQFEAYWKRQLWAECYADVKDQMFSIWQASRDSVVVELPKDIKTMGGDVMWSADVRAAIEAQGLQVAP